MAKKKNTNMLEAFTPLLFNITRKGIHIQLSKRFLLFSFLQKISNRIDEEPYLNFLSILKFHKVIGKTLNGTVRELHRDRNKVFFKHFFTDNALYLQVKRDLVEVHAINKEAKLTILKNGLLIYDNYKHDLFNVLLLTIHSGQFVPKKIEKKLFLSTEERTKEEDIHSDKLYRNIVLRQGGIWVDNKMSRFYCDLNRSKERCIYDVENKDIADKKWESTLTKKERKDILSFYDESYYILEQLINAYKFNLVFDGHTMRDEKDRPNISFGTHYIPKFYLPIVASLKRRMMRLGYANIGINKPYEGGHILAWMQEQFPSIFIFSMEINKKLYLYADKLRVKDKEIEKISEDLVHIFEIEEEEGYRLEGKSLTN